MGSEGTMRRRYQRRPQRPEPKLVRMRLTGAPEDIDDLLADLSTTRWAFGQIDTYLNRDGSTSIYAQLKRVES